MYNKKLVIEKDFMYVKDNELIKNKTDNISLSLFNELSTLKTMSVEFFNKNEIFWGTLVCFDNNNNICYDKMVYEAPQVIKKHHKLIKAIIKTTLSKI